MSTSSRFGLNLFLQLLLTVAFYMLGGIISITSSIRPLAEIFQAMGSITWLSFVLGFIYALFRLFGLKGRAIEHYYQNFPIGFTLAKNESSPTSDGAQSEARPKNLETETKGFEWDDLFTPRYLRYAGILLILSSIFSLLFRIDWQLIHKIFAAFLVAGAGIFGAEYFRKRDHRTLTTISFIIGFAALQFGLTLSAMYCSVNHNVDSSTLASSTLVLKFLLGLAGLWFLRRYYSDFAPGLYFAILYIAPLSLTSSGLSLPYLHLLIFVIALTGTALTYSLNTSRAAIMVLNVFIANIFALGFLGFHETTLSSGWLGDLKGQPHASTAFAGILCIYALHLIFSYIYALKHKESSADAQSTHIIAIHALTALGLCALLPWIPMLSGQYGLTLLVLSVPSFILSLQISSTEKTKQIASTYLFASLALSTLGLFLETKGPWTAIVFLLYSCGILWYSLVFGQRTTRIFAFVALTASLFKLYTECSELFDSIPGSVAILIVGGVLLLLANKMDEIKAFIERQQR